MNSATVGRAGAAQTSAAQNDAHASSTSTSSSVEGSETSGACWSRHDEHYFVLSTAGKPIYSLHGDDMSLAGLAALCQALVSVAAEAGDALRSIRFGPVHVAFVIRGPLILVAASSTGADTQRRSCSLGGWVRCAQRQASSGTALPVS